MMKEKEKIEHIIFEKNYQPRIERNELILKRINFDKCDSILDIGCGMGELLEAIKKKNVRKVGIDNDKKCLKFTKKNAPDAKVIKSNAVKLPFKKNEFDVVTAVGIVEHVENPTRVVKESLRVCRKGGQGVFVTPNLGRLSRIFAALRSKEVYERSGHKQGWDYFLFQRFLENCGWKVNTIVTRFVDVPFYSYLPKRVAKFLSYGVFIRLFPKVGSELFAFCEKPIKK